MNLLLRNCGRKSFQNWLRWVNLMCGDTLLGCLHVAFLIGGLLPAIWSGHVVFLSQIAAVLYGFVVVIIAIVASKSAMGRGRHVLHSQERVEP